MYTDSPGMSHVKMPFKFGGLSQTFLDMAPLPDFSSLLWIDGSISHTISRISPDGSGDEYRLTIYFADEFLMNSL